MSTQPENVCDKKNLKPHCKRQTSTCCQQHLDVKTKVQPTTNTQSQTLGQGQKDKEHKGDSNCAKQSTEAFGWEQNPGAQILELKSQSSNQAPGDIEIQQLPGFPNQTNGYEDMRIMEAGEEVLRQQWKLRTTMRRTMREGGKTRQAEESFVRDAGKVWNQAPTDIQDAPKMGIAKQQIRQYCKTLLI